MIPRRGTVLLAIDYLADLAGAVGIGHLNIAVCLF